MDFLAIDPLAVLAAGAAIFAISLVWQGLVMKTWPGVTPVIARAVLALVTAYALGLIIVWSGMTGRVPGAILGFIAALGLIAPALLQLTFSEQRPVTLFRLGLIHILIELTVAGAILGGW
ncbi:DUF1761 domain-containing protein [Govanella unica]|uniref:DUF1761 domain-containing protein n=1 Tax=Govanella unica TaxID=2975056 RepID=A0A9X3TY26_9PROT|nr:DUF1761 domain-containing protein [Govania unica]MDA5193763.1 DUF1761 domain-containing protein [Govania unica]